MADVQKVPGAAVRLALVAGAYDAVVGRKSGIVECHVTVSDGGVTELDPSTCTAVVPSPTASKGAAGDDDPRAVERDATNERDSASVDAGSTPERRWREIAPKKLVRARVAEANAKEK